MATSAADVPGRFDLVISGGSLANPVGFVFLDALEPSLPFRTHRAIYSYTPTFIERSNVSGNFGDNQQDFFLTSSQRDWTEGEQQRFFRASDQDSVRRYWHATNIDISVPGKVSLRPLTTTTSAFGSAVTAMVADPNGARIFATSSTNLFEISVAGTITDRGAHGLGTQPLSMSLGGGLGTVYMTSTGGGTVGVRKWDGATFSTYSATSNDQLAFLNNTLYGISVLNAVLYKYDTAGTASTVYTWKDAAGNSIGVRSKLIPYGGKLIILREFEELGTGIYIYDGSGVSLVAQLPRGFTGDSIAVVAGTVFIGGHTYKRLSSTRYVKPTIYFYANGTIGKLWEADSFITSTVTVPDYVPQVTPFANGLVFNDDTLGTLMFYNPDTGGVSTIGTYSVGTGQAKLESTSEFLLLSRGTTTPYRFPSDGYATSGTVSSSLFDFDSSLSKLFRGIKVDYDAATDGNGGSVDISYQVDSVDGAYTSLQTSAVSGTEYTFSGSGHTLSVQITLNKGTSTAGPVLKRISVRAAPILTAFRMGEYVIDCTGDGGRSPRALRDGTPNPLSGSESMAQLEIAKASTSPLTFTDRRGTYTGFIETLEGYEEHPGIDDPTRSGEFVTKMITRGV